jgi:hypothetical protein
MMAKEKKYVSRNNEHQSGQKLQIKLVEKEHKTLRKRARMFEFVAFFEVVCEAINIVCMYCIAADISRKKNLSIKAVYRCTWLSY